MQHSLLSGSLLTMLAMVMAGCTGTGNFDVQQTEPFRVQLEGEPQTIVVDEDDDEAQEVVIDTCPDPCSPRTGDDDDGDDCADETRTCSVNVKVQVKQTSSDVCRILIVIKDRDSGEVLDQVEIDGGDDGGDDDGDDGGDDTTTTGNGTSATMTADSGGDTNIVVQNIVVNVKGKDNIVVLTQAIEGAADVDISAASATGNADADASIDDGDDGSTASATMTTSNTTTGS